MPLFIETAFYSARGARRDEQTCLIVVPTAERDTGHGSLCVIAHGIPGRPAPESAAQDALKSLGENYYTAPENWGLKHAMQESFAAANHALLSRGDKNRAAALTALVLRRRRWALIQAGNTRAWLVRNREIKLLTRDHITPRPAGGPQVDRACGYDAQLEPDYFSGELAEGDVFILTNPAAHGALTGADILACAITETSAPQIATSVADRAARAGGGHQAAACVVRVEQVPNEAQEDLEEDIAALPVVTPPAVGETIDDFRIERLVHKSSRYRLFKAVDTQGGEFVMLKFPNPRDAGNNPGFAEQFLREEWIGRRVTSAHLVQTLPLKKGRRTVLYSLMAYPKGESLAKRIARKGTLSVRETAFLGNQLLEALAQLHDQGIVHNDVRPQNIVMNQKNGQLMLLGLGASYVRQTGATTDALSSTMSTRTNFLAPELFSPRPEPTIRTDIYAAAVIIYRVLTGSYPYGKVSATEKPPRGEYVPVAGTRADVPAALDAVLQRACALDPENRYESAQEFSEALDAAAALRATTPATGRAALGHGWKRELAAIAVLIAAVGGYLVFALRK